MLLSDLSNGTEIANVGALVNEQHANKKRLQNCFTQTSIISFLAIYVSVAKVFFMLPLAPKLILSLLEEEDDAE